MSSQKPLQSTKSPISSVIVGIDVSSTKLDICLKKDSSFEFLQVANSQAGVLKLIKQLEKKSKNVDKMVAKTNPKLAVSNSKSALLSSKSKSSKSSLKLNLKPNLKDKTSLKLKSSLNPDLNSDLNLSSNLSSNLTSKPPTNSANTNTTIILEATGSYHWQASLMLKNRGFQVKVINPLITKKYQKASIRSNKTDKIDAQRLTEIAVVEGAENLPDFTDNQKTLAAKQYQTQLKMLSKVKQELEASLKQAEEESLKSGLNNDFSSIQELLTGVKKAKKEIEQKLVEKASSLAKEISEKTKGLSLLQATILTNAIDGKIFQNREQITAFFGLDIKKRESGNWQGRERLSKRGNPFYRKTLFQLGWSLKCHNEIYKEYYNKQKEEKQKHYYTAILATARKFLRYFFKELKAYQREKAGLNPSFT